MCEALRLWTRRNPLDTTPPDKPRDRPRDRSNKLLNSRQSERPKQRGCVYCEDTDHKSSDCPKVLGYNERKQVLVKQRRCFNCTGEGHRAGSCKSKMSCQNCERRHHTSICDQQAGERKILSTAKCGEGTFPVVVVKVGEITCRALIDSGAGSSYASAAKLIGLLKKKPIKVSIKKVDMLMSTRVERLETYGTEIESMKGDFSMQVSLIKVNKTHLLTVDNPNYEALIGTHPHLEGVQMDDHETKAQLPIHVVLGGGEYARIKTKSRPRIGKEGEPVAELTKLGWFIMSPGKEFDHHHMRLTQTTQSDYEELCRLNVLGLAHTAEHDQESVYSEFKE